MKRNRVLRAIFLAIGTVVVFYVATVGWFILAEDACGNELLSESASPDKSMKAVVFQRDCGATTGFSTQVSIIPSAANLPNESGNAFRSDTNHGAAPSGPGGGPEVKVQWQSAAELLISHHPAARILKLEATVGSIRIRQEAVPLKQDG